MGEQPELQHTRPKFLASTTGSAVAQVTDLTSSIIGLCTCDKVPLITRGVPHPYEEGVGTYSGNLIHRRLQGVGCREGGSQVWGRHIFKVDLPLVPQSSTQSEHIRMSPHRQWETQGLRFDRIPWGILRRSHLLPTPSPLTAHIPETGWSSGRRVSDLNHKLRKLDPDPSIPGRVLP